MGKETLNLKGAMIDMIKLVKIAGYCLGHAILYPKTQLENVLGNPIPVPRQSPIPWWGSAVILVVGIISWCLSAYFGIGGLDEASRAMVYIPLGNIFGMSISIKG